MLRTLQAIRPRFWSSNRGGDAPASDAPSPDATAKAPWVRRDAASTNGQIVYAIGDIHGRDDLLSKLLEQITAETADGREVRRPILMFLGDYIDRGPTSREVIERLVALKRDQAFEARFLAGNHEFKMLRFLDAEADDDRIDWLIFGGRETLASYGVVLDGLGSAEGVAEARRQLLENLPPDHLAFLRDLESSAVIGDYFFVHAGVRPDVPLCDQSDEDMMSIRHPFLSLQEGLEKVIVHGHTAEAAPYHSDIRIGVDTGAHATGILTAVRLNGQNHSFIQAKARA